jgi:hypothetical protein
LIRAVGNKRLELSEDEFKYFCALKDQFGGHSFAGLFDTNKNGIITTVNPPTNKNVPLGVIFFLLNVMMNQRVRILDKKINKISELEIRVDKFVQVNNIVERIEILENKIKNSMGEKDVKTS